MEIKILEKVLAANDQIAEEIRKKLDIDNVTAVNIMSSPGSGKTTIIEKTIKLLKEKTGIGIIEGDIATSLDSERLSCYNVPIVEINTGPFGGDCHLEAGWIKQALSQLNLKFLNLVLIENIGNLVCPAEFDTGAHKNVAVLSLPEGEDKPLKYPLMFHKSDLVLINKCDLINALDVNIDLIISNIKKINPTLDIIKLSAKTGDGLNDWISWLEDNIRSRKVKRRQYV
jgi:hydrogenase nickel incorporation protein HypB